MREMLLRDKQEALIGSVMEDESVCLKLMKEYSVCESRNTIRRYMCPNLYLKERCVG